MFKVAFRTDNAAFDGDMYTEEVAAILRKLADRLEGMGAADATGNLTDTNGNVVGTWTGNR